MTKPARSTAIQSAPASAPSNGNVSLGKRLAGYILLQVEDKGQAWYANPADGKRYYLGNGDLAFQIMRYLSLGISNQNLNTINVGQ